MKAKIDDQSCIGCGVCNSMCPDVFEMKGDKAEVCVTVVPKNAEDSCRQAADSCPVACISIE